MDKNLKLEKYIIFTTIVQMNLIEHCTQLIIDGTFKASPKGFYQIFNISGFYPNINGIIPLFMIPMMGKSESIYNSIFSDIKTILETNGIKDKNIPNHIMIDFEKPLQNAVKKNFPKAKIDGCYFHFVKLLWTKAKTLGLTTK